MIKVRGASYRPIHLTDLKDNVFYGQEKVYSEAQYARCPQLAQEIQKGTVVLVERTEEAPAGFVAPEAVMTQNPGWYQDLVGKIQEVKEIATAKPEAPAPAPIPAPIIVQAPQAPAAFSPEVGEMLRTLVEKVDSLTSKVDTSAASPAQALSPAVTEQLNELSRKLDGMRVTGPGVVETSYSFSETPFIPTSAIRVDDLSNNVNLETKSLGQGSGVNDALAALKNMKKTNSTPIPEVSNG